MAFMEKFIVSLKLKKQLEILDARRREMMQGMVNGENYTNDDIAEINKKIDEVNKKLEKLLYME